MGLCVFLGEKDVSPGEIPYALVDRIWATDFSSSSLKITSSIFVKSLCVMFTQNLKCNLPIESSVDADIQLFRIMKSMNECIETNDRLD